MCCGHLVPVALLTWPLTKYLSGNYFKGREILDLFFGTGFWILLALKKKKDSCGWKNCTCTGRWCNCSCSSLLRTSRWHLKYTQVNKGGSEYNANRYLHSLCPFPWKCLCCIFDAFLEKVKWHLIYEMSRETSITLIPEAQLVLLEDKPWLSWQ